MTSTIRKLNEKIAKIQELSEKKEDTTKAIKEKVFNFEERNEFLSECINQKEEDYRKTFAAKTGEYCTQNPVTLTLSKIFKKKEEILTKEEDDKKGKKMASEDQIKEIIEQQLKEKIQSMIDEYLDTRYENSSFDRPKEGYSQGLSEDEHEEIDSIETRNMEMIEGN